MKKLFYILIILSFSTPSIGQTNLVPNPSFENIVQCPFSFGLEAYTSDWKSARASPDYFNSCATTWIAGVPSNDLGYQQANSGNAYIGLLTYRSDTSIYTEAASVQLLAPLIIGQTYYVSFKLSLALEYTTGSMAATNKIGVQFSKTSYSSSSPMPVNNYAHVWTDSIISDSLNWKTIQGAFVADSNYTHLSLGNFFDKQYVDSIIYGPTFGAYYYFDDICVSSNPNYCYTLTKINEYNINKALLIYPNPTSTNLHIEFLDQSKITKVILSNQFGNAIIQNSNFGGALDLKDLPNGLYFIEIISDGKNYYDKIVVRH